MFFQPTHKILSDGTEVPATDPRTDHIALLFADGTLTLADSIGIADNSRPFASHQKAESGVAAIEFLGRKFQLAGDDEAQAYFIDRDFDPCVNPSYYPRMKATWHWLRNTCAWSKNAAGVASHAFSASLDGGNVGGSHRGFSGFGLAVSRPGQ